MGKERSYMKVLDEKNLKETSGGFMDVIMMLSFSSYLYQLMKKHTYISAHFWSM